VKIALIVWMRRGLPVFKGSAHFSEGFSHLFKFVHLMSYHGDNGFIAPYAALIRLRARAGLRDQRGELLRGDYALGDQKPD
jgi:hypothetical protein